MASPPERARHGARKHLPKGLLVLYEDDDLLVVDKPAGMLTMGTDREKVRTAYYALTNYVRKGNPKSRARVFIVHRLDRETSGVVVFAKNEPAKRALQEAWERAKKEYLAVVEGIPKESKGRISGYLAETKAYRVYATTDGERGKFAQTDYAVLTAGEGRALLSVTLRTGRKHQIRVHLADSGHPVVGDRKYGSEKGAVRRLALHAHQVTLTHPTTRKRLTFTAPPPQDFDRLIPRGRGPEAGGRGAAKPRKRESSGEGVEVVHHGRRRTRKKPDRRGARIDPRRGGGTGGSRSDR